MCADTPVHPWFPFPEGLLPLLHSPTPVLVSGSFYLLFLRWINSCLNTCTLGSPSSYSERPFTAHPVQSSALCSSTPSLPLSLSLCLSLCLMHTHIHTRAHTHPTLSSHPIYFSSWHFSLPAMILYVYLYICFFFSLLARIEVPHEGTYAGLFTVVSPVLSILNAQ